MSTILLDSSVLIDILNGLKKRKELIHQLIEEGYFIATCSIIVSEIYAGMLPREQEKTDRFLSHMEYFEINFNIARKAGILKHEWARKGHTLTLSDTIIASLAIERNLMLITDNIKHFPMKELDLRKPEDFN